MSDPGTDVRVVGTVGSVVFLLLWGRDVLACAVAGLGAGRNRTLCVVGSIEGYVSSGHDFMCRRTSEGAHPEHSSVRYFYDSSVRHPGNINSVPDLST